MWWGEVTDYVTTYVLAKLKCVLCCVCKHSDTACHEQRSED